jgi:hypothetical protein
MRLETGMNSAIQLMLSVIVLLLLPQVIRAETPLLSGQYELVDVRRASDVAGGPVEESTIKLIGSTASFAEKFVFPGLDGCTRWSVKASAKTPLNENDPMLSDTQIAPIDGDRSAGDKRLNLGLKIFCEGEYKISLLKVDERILVVPTASGIGYLIFERSLSGEETKRFQFQLRDMKFYSGSPSSSWDEDSFRALSFYAEYRGAEYRFARTAISENLLDALGVIQPETETSRESAD